MGFFGRNNFIDIIENRSDAGVLAIRNEIEDFNKNSKIRVAEGEIAILYCSERQHNDDKIVKVYGAGEHIVKNGNDAFWGGLASRTTGGKALVGLSVVFIRTAISPSMSWGCDGATCIKDPESGYLVDLFVRADFTIRVEKRGAEIFMRECVGNMPDCFTYEKAAEHIAPKINAVLKPTIETLIRGLKSVMDLSSHVYDLSESFKNNINNKLADIGLNIYSFDISAVELGDESKNKLDEYHVGKFEYLRSLEHQQEMLLNNMQSGASDTFSAGGGIQSLLRDVMDKIERERIRLGLIEQPQQDTVPSNQAQNSVPTSYNNNFPSFDLDITPVVATPPTKDRISRLKELKEYYDARLITTAEYEERKAEILNEL